MASQMFRKVFGKKEPTKKTEQTEGPEIIIAVMGVTGSGKSTLINTITGNNSVSVGKTLKSTTKEVRAVDWRYKGRAVKLIDTPGFDDTYLSDLKVLSQIAAFLQLMYERRVRINGLLYLHRITDIRMTGSGVRNIKIFQELCGQESLQNVILVTTFWKATNQSISQSREQELLQDFWKPMIDAGSRMQRFVGTKTSARNLVDSVFQSHSTVLEIQKELVDQRRELWQTQAGALVQRDARESVQHIENELTDLQAELDAAFRAKDMVLAQVIETEKSRYESRLRKLNADQFALKREFQRDVQALREKMRAVARQGTPLESGPFWTVYENGVELRESDRAYETENWFSYRKVLGEQLELALETMMRLGNLYIDQEKMVEAEAMYRRALIGYENTLGSDHLQTLHAANKLSDLHRSQGEMAEISREDILAGIEQMYREELEDYEQTKGLSDISTLGIANNLGNLYQEIGKMEEAEEMYLRALRGLEKVCGPNHTSTLNTVNNIGNLYVGLGKMLEAERMYLRALNGFEKGWGFDHLSTIQTFSNLGALYQVQGKLVDAEEMNLRALRGLEKVCGPNHTSTLNTVNNIGNLYVDLGKMPEAERMYLRALNGFEKAFGPDHPSTLDSVNNLGVLYQDLGKMEEAETMYMRALQGKEKVLGKEHPSTLTIKSNLATVLQSRGELKTAEDMKRQVLEGRKRILGAGHPDTLSAMNNLASTLGDIGQFYEATEMMREVLEKRKRVLGEEHPDTIRAMNNLASTLGDLGELHEAVAMKREVLEKRMRILGEEHPDTLSAISNLTNTLRDLGQLNEAVNMRQEVLEKRRRILGEEHPDTISAIGNLANTLGDLGQLQTSAQMMREVLEKRKRILGETHPDTISAMNNLASTLGDLGEFDEAIALLEAAIQSTSSGRLDDNSHAKVIENNLARLRVRRKRASKSE